MAAGKFERGASSRVEFAEVVEVVIRVEELAGVVVSAKGEFGAYVAGVGACYVVRDKVDDGFEAAFFDALEKGFEFIEPLGGVGGVVGANVKVITDGVGRSGFAFEKQWAVSGALRVGGGAGLFEYPGKP